MNFLVRVESLLLQKEEKDDSEIAGVPGRAAATLRQECKSDTFNTEKK